MKQSSDNNTNHELLDGLESIKSALNIGDTPLSEQVSEQTSEQTNEKAELSLENVPVLHDVVNTPAADIELDDLDEFDAQTTSVDELLSRVFTVDETDANIENGDYKTEELTELLQMEAEQIREEILAEFLPRMEQSFKDRMQEATSEILGELIERRMQARLKGYK